MFSIYNMIMVVIRLLEQEEMSVVERISRQVMVEIISYISPNGTVTTGTSANQKSNGWLFGKYTFTANQKLSWRLPLSMW